MAFVATRSMPQTAAPSDGSRTITVTNAQPVEDVGSGEEGSNVNGENVVGVLRLQAQRTRSQGPRVAWTEDVIDNEGMGKKKSKICCIYHKPRRFDESSSDESSSDSDSDDSGCGGHSHGHDHRHPRLPNFRRRRGSSDEDNTSDTDSGSDAPNRSNFRHVRSPGSERLDSGEVDSEPDMNAYERQPRKGKGKDKGGDAD